MAKEPIDVDICTWKEDTIFHIFSRTEVELILSLPISIYGARDKLTWWPARNEIFLVKSAYFLENQHRKHIKG